MKKHTLLGVLGGLGPMSTVYFCELLTRHTRALCDSDHIDMIVSSRATTPDRTAFILGESKDDPLPIMIEEVHRLERAGADMIVIPCNTAHYFYEGIARACNIPVLNIIEETVLHLTHLGVRSMGLLATEGTVRSGAYEKIASAHNIQCLTPDDDDQAVITSVIYDQIKQNKPVDRDAFLRVAERLRERGCGKLVLGCTELSLIKKEYTLPNYVIDSLEVLCISALRTCNKVPTGFDDNLLKLYNSDKVN